jgi:hypothetical protein
MIALTVRVADALSVTGLERFNNAARHKNKNTMEERLHEQHNTDAVIR